MLGGERTARRRLARTALAPPLICIDGYSYGLGVKGSLVRTLSSRRPSLLVRGGDIRLGATIPAVRSGAGVEIVFRPAEAMRRTCQDRNLVPTRHLCANSLLGSPSSSIVATLVGSTL